MKTYSHIRQALEGKLWHVHEQKMNEMLAFLEIKLSGGSSSAETIAAIRAANEISAARAAGIARSGGGTVAVIPVFGLLMHRGSMMGDVSGPACTSYDGLTQQIRQAVSDPNVKAIVLDFDSPGGEVAGCDELAAEIYNARKQKKITAVSDGCCASAAYYLACQASEVVVSPSSLTGSIGVFTMHRDESAALEKAGIKLTLIAYGENKAEDTSIAPLSDSAHEHLLQTVTTFGVMFEKAVARGRKISQADVHNKFGQGRVFDAKQAVKLGMADRIATLDEVLQGYGVSRGPGSANSASSAVPAFSAADTTDPDLDDNDCACACEPCKGGDCSACSHEACACDGCTCDSAAAKTRKAKQSLQRRRLELAAL